MLCHYFICDQIASQSESASIRNSISILIIAGICGRWGECFVATENVMIFHTSDSAAKLTMTDMQLHNLISTWFGAHIADIFNYLETQAIRGSRWPHCQCQWLSRFCRASSWSNFEMCGRSLALCLLQFSLWWFNFFALRPRWLPRLNLNFWSFVERDTRWRAKRNYNLVRKRKFGVEPANTETKEQYSLWEANEWTTKKWNKIRNCSGKVQSFFSWIFLLELTASAAYKCQKQYQSATERLLAVSWMNVFPKKSSCINTQWALTLLLWIIFAFTWNRTKSRAHLRMIE